MWAMVFVVTFLATVGFAGMNIADVTASRARVADQGAALAQRVTQLRTERAAILEMRPVPAIEVELLRGSAARSGGHVTGNEAVH